MSFRREFARMEHSIYEEFDRFWKDSRCPWQAIRFVQRALQQRYKVEVARLLSTKAGNSLLGSLLDVGYPSEENACFEEYVMPLCYLLSDEKLVSCNKKYLDMIYRAVLKHEAFFDRYVRFLKDVSDSMSSNMLSSFRIKNGFDAIIPFMDLGFFILTRLGSFENRANLENSMREAVDLVRLFRERKANQVQNMTRWTHLLDHSKDRLERVLNPALPVAIEASSNYSISLTRDGLDALEEMRTMPLLPTEDEILSFEEPAQESNDWYGDKPRSPCDDVVQYAQEQFNDMRQKIILPHRVALRYLIQESLFLSKPRFFRFRDEVCEGLCDLFWDVRVEGLDTRYGRGGCFRISMEQRFKHEDSDMRKKAWNPVEGGHLLENFSVVCIVFYDADVLGHDRIDTESMIPGCRLVFGHVSIAARRDLYGDYQRSYLEVMMESETDINNLLDIAFGQPSAYTHCSVGNLKAVMLQLRSPFIDVAHALSKSLQNSDWVNLSWAKQFAKMKQETPLNEEHRLESTREDCSADLSFLVRDDLDPLVADSAREGLMSVDIGDPRAVYQKLRHHSAGVVLDDSQKKAFSTCLGNGLSLIQGNPAFGESEVVSYIAKALLSRRAPPSLKWAYDSMTAAITNDFDEREVLESGPILCIGLSNSAADDVLEKLISMNLLRENEVLRLGGQSKSARIRHRSLKAVLNQAPFGVPAEVRSYTKRVMREMTFQFNWCLKNHPIDTNNLKACAGEILKLSKDLQSMKILDTLGAMKGIKFVGCTASGSALHGDLIRALAPSTIIFMGAHGMHDPNILGVQTSSTKHVVLSGDHFHPGPFEAIQQRHRGKTTGEGNGTLLFRRLVQTGAAPVETLTVQYQMHPTISKLPRISYEIIQDSDHVCHYPNAPRGLAKSLYFLDRCSPEERTETSAQQASHITQDVPQEMEFTSNLVRYLILQDYSPHQIAVLSPSLKHLIHIKERLSSLGIQGDFMDKARYKIARCDLLKMGIDPQRRTAIMSPVGQARKEEECVMLGTSHDFVRNVRDVLIVTMAVGNASGSIGEFEDDSVVNSMITRARYGMIILGCSTTIRNAKGGKLLKGMLAHLEKESLIGTSLPLQCQDHGNVTHVAVTEALPEGGGCNQVCGKKMECGHLCLEICHPPGLRCTNLARCRECERG